MATVACGPRRQGATGAECAWPTRDVALAEAGLGPRPATEVRLHPLPDAPA